MLAVYLADVSISARNKNYHLYMLISMPRVVCSSTLWVLTKRSRKSYQKKGAKRQGFHHKVSTTKPALRENPNSCPTDRYYIAGFGRRKFKIKSSKLLQYRDKHYDDNFPKIIIDACQVSPFQLVTITIIWVYKLVCQESYVNPHSEY